MRCKWYAERTTLRRCFGIVALVDSNDGWEQRARGHGSFPAVTIRFFNIWGDIHATRSSYSLPSVALKPL